MANKVFVIGLDGATWDLIEPWAREGKLPTFKRLMDEGAWGTLWCPTPPISPQSWASFATGKNPGKHGFIDFVEMTPHSYTTRFINARMRAGKSLWRLLSDLDRSVGVINVPITYPPEPVNGFLVAGYLSPGKSSPFVYPAELRKELLAAVPHYMIECADIEVPRLSRRDPRTAYIERVLAMMEGRRAATRWLYERFRPDLFMATFTAFDRICHYFWKYMDPAVRGRFSDEEIARYGDAIFRVHVRQDEIIAELLEMIEPGTTVFVMSDHGFGPSYKRLNLQRWLVEQDFLTLKRTRPGPFGRLVNAVISASVRFTPLQFRHFIKQKLPWLATRAMSRVYFQGIDWSRTRVYAVGEIRSLFINLKGRQPQGIVEPSEYEALRDEVIAKLMALREPETGDPVVDKVWRREELYSGEFVWKMPDLLVDWHDYGYSFIPDFDEGPLVSSILDSASLQWDRNGFHRPNGVFLAWGKDIRRGARVEGVVMDVTATVLYEMGFPVPGDMDGRVLTGAYTPERIESDPPRTSDMDTSAQADSTDVYSEEDARQVSKRLKELGYLE
ncbi:MAG: alkaline phosphatase family protein [Verrucomicrobia bacterium]|nr:alkaline phosphatase family protein [Verrucomicrobiota bacterium]